MSNDAAKEEHADKYTTSGRVNMGLWNEIEHFLPHDGRPTSF